MATNSNDYSNLRSLLDSLEVGALRFYLSGPAKAQPQRLKYLRGKLMPIVKELWPPRRGKELELDGPCPLGFYDCNGVCQPYPCGEQLVARKKGKAAKKR